MAIAVAPVISAAHAQVIEITSPQTAPGVAAAISPASSAPDFGPPDIIIMPGDTGDVVLGSGEVVLVQEGAGAPSLDIDATAGDNGALIAGTASVLTGDNTQVQFTETGTGLVDLAGDAAQIFIDEGAVLNGSERGAIVSAIDSGVTLGGPFTLDNAGLITSTPSPGSIGVFDPPAVFLRGANGSTIINRETGVMVGGGGQFESAIGLDFDDSLGGDGPTTIINSGQIGRLPEEDFGTGMTFVRGDLVVDNDGFIRSVSISGGDADDVTLRPEASATINNFGSGVIGTVNIGGLPVSVNTPITSNNFTPYNLTINNAQGAQFGFPASEGFRITGSITHAATGALRVDNAGTMAFGSFGGINFSSGDTIITNAATGRISALGNSLNTNFGGTVIFGAPTIDESAAIPLIDNFGQIIGSDDPFDTGNGAIVIEGEARIINRPGALISENDTSNTAIRIEAGTVENQAGATISGVVGFVNLETAVAEDQFFLNTGNVNANFTAVVFEGTGHLHGATVGSAHTGTIAAGDGEGVLFEGPLGADLVNEGIITSSEGEGIQITQPNGFTVINRNLIRGGDSVGGEGFAVNFFPGFVPEPPDLGVGALVINESGGEILGGISFAFEDPDRFTAANSTDVLPSGTVQNFGLITGGFADPDDPTSIIGELDALTFETGGVVENALGAEIRAENDAIFLRGLFPNGALVIRNEGLIEGGGAAIATNDDFSAERLLVVDILNEETGIIRGGEIALGSGNDAGSAIVDLNLVNHGLIEAMGESFSPGVRSGSTVGFNPTLGEFVVVGTASLLNTGTIMSTGQAFEAGMLVANANGNALNSGTITSVTNQGVSISDLLTDFVNTGVIEGGTDGLNVGEALGSGTDADGAPLGATITNASGARIETSGFGFSASGVEVNFGRVTILNDGEILAPTGVGLGVSETIVEAIDNSGRIQGEFTGVDLFGGGGLFINRGTGIVEATRASNFTAGVSVFGGEYEIVNEIGGRIEATGNNENARGITVAEGFSPTSVTLTNAGLIDGGAGRGVEYLDATIAGFENTGTIRGGQNAVEVGNLNGQTLFNRTGGLIDTTSAGNGFNGFNGVALFGGSGSIINEDGATISASMGTNAGGESAIFVDDEAGAVNIVNDGTLSGVFTVLTFNEMDLTNRGDILATQVTDGDAVNILGGGVFVNEAGGEVVATRDAVYIEDQSEDGRLTTVFNALGATITGDSDNTGGGLAIATFDVGDNATAGREQITNAGLIEGGIDLGAGDDALTVTASGTITGTSAGGGGVDALTIDVAPAGRSIAEGDFTGFETIALNSSPGAAGTLLIGAASDPDAAATLDTGGASGSSITLAAGTLALSDGTSSVRAETVTAAAATTVSGIGTVFGNTVASGTLSPGNSVGQITIDGDLTLSETSLLAFELGEAGPDPLTAAPGGMFNDLIVVTGNLVLDGSLTVTESTDGDFTTGVYRLINYDGAITDQGLVISGFLPNALAGTVQTDVAQQVNLVVADAGVSVQFWDGTDRAPGNGTIDGGTDVWNAANTNWTEGDGGGNAPWDSGVGTFAGTSGIVTVEGEQAFVGLQFVVNDYQLVTGTDGALSLGSGGFISVDEDIEATVAVELRGTGALSKQGQGRLIVDAASTLDGADLVAGILENRGALTLDDGLSMLDGTSFVNTAGAELTSATTGVLGASGTQLIENAGEISGLAGNGIALNGSGSLVNTGTITGTAQGVSINALVANGAGTAFENDGTISGRTAGVFVSDLNGQTLMNSGTIENSDPAQSGVEVVELFGGSGGFINSGTIQLTAPGAASLSDLSRAVLVESGVIGLTFENSGDIIANRGIAVDIEGDLASFENSGLISATGNDGIEIDNLTGITLYNRSGGVIETNSETGIFGGNSTAALIIDQGSGGLVNEAGAVIRTNDGTGAETAVFASVNVTDFTVQNSGEIRSTGIAVEIQGNASAFENHGDIIAGNDAVQVQGVAGPIVNNGNIISGAEAVQIIATAGDITNSGLVEGVNSGFFLADMGSTTLTNRTGGVIRATSGGTSGAAVNLSGGTLPTIINEAGATIENTGGLGLDHAIRANASVNQLTIENAGTLIGASGISSSSDTTVITSGRIETRAGFLADDAVEFNATSSLVNQTGGVITASRDAIIMGAFVAGIGDGEDQAYTITNEQGATITGNDDAMDDGSGRVGLAINGVLGSDTVINAGVITGGIELAGQNDTVQLLGTAETIGDIDLGADADRLELTDATVFTGAATGGAGSDLLVFDAQAADQAFDNTFSEFETLEKLGAFETQITSALSAADGRIFGGALEIGNADLSSPVTGTLTLDGPLLMGAGSDADAITELRVVTDASSISGSPTLAITGDFERQEIFNAGTINATIDLGGGDDSVVNFFGAYNGDISLGDGNDELEVFLLDAGAGAIMVPGAINGLVDGGLGTDTLRYSLETGQVTLTSPPAIGGSGGEPTNFEQIAKGGGGIVIFAFDDPDNVMIGGSSLSTNTFDIEGPAIFASSVTASIVPDDDLSGFVRVGAANSPGGDVAGALENQQSLTVERAITFDGLATFVNTADATVNVGLAGSTAGAIIGDGGAQTITNDGTITLLDMDATAGRLDLGGGADTLALSTTGTIIGESDGGAGIDSLEIDAAMAGRSLDEGDFVNFETINLNADAGADGTFTVLGATAPMAAATLDAGTGAGSSVALNSGQLALIETESSVRAATVMAADGTTVSGIGTVFGSTMAAGTLSPGNSVGQLTFDGDLTLTDTSLLAFELGEAGMVGGMFNDLITVTGDLVLDGNLTVAESDGGTFTAGVYRLIDFGGTLTDLTLDIAGVLPGGLSGTVQTVVANQVNLVVTTPGVLVQFWDGPNFTGDGVIDGGTSTWNAANTNWTTDTGTPNAPWGSGIGIFAGSTGVVTVEGVQAFEGLQFVTGDYQLVTGAGGGLSLGTGGFINVDAGLDTTIDVALQGSGILDKQGDGRLILTADSTYAGGTAVSDGTLAVGTDGALGPGSVALADGTVLQAVAADLTLANTVSVDAPGAAVAQVDTQAFDLTLSAAVAGGDDDRLSKQGDGQLTLLAGGLLRGGLDLEDGTLENRGALEVMSDLSMGDGLAGSTTALRNIAGATLDAGTNGIIGDLGMQTVDTAGAITGDIDLGDGDDALIVAQTGAISGTSAGGGGTDSLMLDAPAGGRTLTEQDFTGFETITLNPTADATGSFTVAAATVPGSMATLDTGGAAGSSIALERGALALVDPASALRAQNVTIAAGATLSGVGTIFTRPAGASGAFGAATVQGTISPGGGGIGTLRVDGDYVQSGTYELGFRAPADLTNIQDGALFGRNTLDDPAAAADADLIDVSGTGTLTGGAVVLQQMGTPESFETALAADGNTANELRYVVLRAAEGLGGTQFVALSEDDVALDYVDGVADASSEETDVVLVVSGMAPADTDAPAPPVVLQSLAPAPIPLRASNRRAPRCDLEVGGVASSGRCAFASVSGGFGNRDQSVGGDARESDIAGTIGAGGRIYNNEGSNLWTGIALNFGAQDYRAGTGSDADEDRFETYLWSMYLNGPWDARGWAGYAYSDVSQSRQTATGTARSDFNANTYSLAAEGRYWFNVTDTVMAAPVVGISAGWLNRDGYTERGDSLENFQARNESENSVRSLVGMEARWRTNAIGKPLFLTGQVGWLHEYADTRQRISGTFVNDSTQTDLTRSSSSDGRDFLDLGFSAGVALTSSTSLRFGYNAALNDQRNAHGFLLRFSSSF